MSQHNTHIFSSSTISKQYANVPCPKCINEIKCYLYITHKNALSKPRNEHICLIAVICISIHITRILVYIYLYF